MVLEIITLFPHALNMSKEENRKAHRITLLKQRIAMGGIHPWLGLNTVHDNVRDVGVRVRRERIEGVVYKECIGAISIDEKNKVVIVADVCKIDCGARGEACGNVREWRLRKLSNQLQCRSNSFNCIQSAPSAIRY